MIQLRPYQQTARERTNQLLNTGRHPLIVMGAGTGKTKTAIKIIQDRISLGKRLLVLVPQDLIMNQWIKDCSENGVDYGYIKVNSFNEIITDEAHHGAAQSFRVIYAHFPHCLRLGLTASPYRGDGQSLGEFYTDLIMPIKNSEAIEAGYLCKPRIVIPEKYKRHIPENPEEIIIEDQKQYIEEKTIIGDMVQEYKKYFDGMPVIVPCTTHKQGREVRELFQAAGWNVEYFSEDVKEFSRKRIIKRIERRESNILISIGVGVEGLDIPGLYGIIWMRFTESLAIWIQFNGRAARPLEGKKFYTLIDPVGNSVIHGSPALDRNWKLDHGEIVEGEENETLKMQICPVCDTMNSTANIKCWICNYDFITGLLDGEPIAKKIRKLPKMIDGELVYLDGGEDGVINKDINILTEGEDGRSNNSYGGTDDTISNANNSSSSSSDKNKNDTKHQPLTTIQKEQILKKNLTKGNMGSKFYEGVKGWL